VCGDPSHIWCWAGWRGGLRTFRRRRGRAYLGATFAWRRQRVGGLPAERVGHGTGRNLWRPALPRIPAFQDAGRFHRVIAALDLAALDARVPAEEIDREALFRAGDAAVHSVRTPPDRPNLRPPSVRAIHTVPPGAGNTTAHRRRAPSGKPWTPSEPVPHFVTAALPYPPEAYRKSAIPRTIPVETVLRRWPCGSGRGQSRRSA